MKIKTHPKIPIDVNVDCEYLQKIPKVIPNGEMPKYIPRMPMETATKTIKIAKIEEINRKTYAIAIWVNSKRKPVCISTNRKARKASVSKTCLVRRWLL